MSLVWRLYSLFSWRHLSMIQYSDSCALTMSHHLHSILRPYKYIRPTWNMDKYKIPLGCTSVSVPYSQKYNVYMVVTVKGELELRKRQLPHGDHHIGNGWQEHAANVIYFQNIHDWESHKNLGGITGGINDCFFYFRSKGEGGVSANPKNPYQKILRFFYHFWLFWPFFDHFWLYLTIFWPCLTFFH